MSRDLVDVAIREPTKVVVTVSMGGGTLVDMPTFNYQFGQK